MTPYRCSSRYIRGYYKQNERMKERTKLLLFLYYISLLGSVIWDLFMLSCGSWFIANTFAYNFSFETALACGDA